LSRLGRADQRKPAQITKNASAQFARLGVNLAPTNTTEDGLEIMWNAWDSLIAFLSCQTQWHVECGIAGLIWFGLKYAECKTVLEDINAPIGTFADLRVMEAAALPILNEASS